MAGNSIWDLFVSLGLNSGDFEKGIDSAVGKAQSSGASIVGSLSQVGGAVVTGAFVAAGAAAVAMGGYLYESVKAAAEAQDIQAQLAAVIKSTGGAAGVTAKQVNELASAAMKVTKFDDDAVVSGENMLLTFTNIGQDTFPAATQAMLDLSQAMGQDLKSSAIQLGKALNDPTTGMSALQRVGVTFTDEQKKVVAAMMKTGDMAGAQKVILDELNKEFGGSAQAAGSTFAGQMTIIKNNLDDVGKSIGGALLPMLTQLSGQFINWINSPAVQTGIGYFAFEMQNAGRFVTDLAKAFMEGYGYANDFMDGIVNVLYALNMDWAADGLQQAIIWFNDFTAYLQNDQGIIVAVLGTLGVAVTAFGISTLISMAPIILTLGLVAGAIYLLYEGWTTNFGGMRDILTAFWTGTVQPTFAVLVAWLQVNIPIALAWLSNVWTTVLLPAIQSVWAWMQGTLFPLLAVLWGWLQTNIPMALTFLGTMWTDVLLPAITSVWSWITKTLIPTFTEFFGFIKGEWSTAITALSDLWTKTLLPALQGIWNYLSPTLLPLFKDVQKFFDGPFTDAVKNIADVLGKFLGKAFEDIGASISSAIGKVWSLIDAMQKLAQEQGNPYGYGNRNSTLGQGIAEGSGKANGGPVMAGVAYPVGERGPETFVPDTNGTIIPNGAGNVTNIYVSPHYYKGDEPSLMQELSLITAMAAY